MTIKEMAELDFNPLFVIPVLVWDWWIWFITEMTRVENAMNRGGEDVDR